MGLGYLEVHLSKVILTPFDCGCIDIATGELVRLSAFGHPAQSPATTASPIENASTRKEVPSHGRHTSFQFIRAPLSNL